jgi:hypothetical protein
MTAQHWWATMTCKGKGCHTALRFLVTGDPASEEPARAALGDAVRARLAAEGWAVLCACCSSDGAERWLCPPCKAKDTH